MALRAFGVTCCESLPVLAFAVPPNSEKAQTAYLFRLMVNFGVFRDYRRYLTAATRPVTIYAGADDELMFADKYAALVQVAGRCEAA